MKFNNNYVAVQEGMTEMQAFLEEVLGTKEIMVIVDPNEGGADPEEHDIWNKVEEDFVLDGSNDYMQFVTKTGGNIDYDGVTPHLLEKEGRKIVYSGWGVWAIYLTEEMLNYYNSI